jgi:chondroitin AC lyase
MIFQSQKIDFKYLWLRCLQAFLLCSVLVFANAQMIKHKDDFSVIKTRILRDSTQFDVSTTIPDTEGKWKDINYDDTASGDWQPVQHWVRTVFLARRYRFNANDRFAKPTLANGISNAVNFWYKKQPTSGNWWWNSIGVPLLMGEVFLLMDDALSESQRQGAYKLMEVRIKPYYRDRTGPATGQNTVWLATVHLMIGLLQKDSSILEKASNAIKDEVKISSEEGLQPDYSFHQHGSQLYSGGYGKGFAQDVTRYVGLFNGTKYAFSNEKIDIISSYLLDGLQWATYKSTLDYSTLGREITRNEEAGRAKLLSEVSRQMASMDLPRKKEFEAMHARLNGLAATEFIGNKYFWRSDFMTHHAKGFYTSIKYASSRVRATESGIGENQKGWYLGRGVQFIFRTGLEYQQIFPIWDWKRLPGILAEQGNDSLPLYTWGIGAEGKKAFAGGVSDGHYGAVAYDYDYLTVKAKRFWVCFDKELVCLGAGVSCSGDNSLFQSINQCFQNGEVTIGDNTGKYAAFAEGEKTSKDISWVHHDSIGYFFPLQKNITVKAQKQSGSWREVNNQPSNSDSIISKPVFSVWIDLGKKVTNESFSYVIVPNISTKEASSYSNPIKVLRNDTSVQAVQNTLLGLTASSFYQPGSLNIAKGLKLSVNMPVMVMFRQTTDSVNLSVSSPENKSFVVELTVNQKLICDECKWLPEKGVTTVSIQLPGGSYAGRSVTKNMKQKN